MSSDIKLFISYAHDDEHLKNELVKHLAALQREKIISIWHDRDIGAGIEWESTIARQLDEANIILLLISASFIYSDYCSGIELTTALSKHSAGTARVIPILLRPVDWTNTPFARLQALPPDGVPVTSSPNSDEAFSKIAKGIRAVAAELATRQTGTLLTNHQSSSDKSPKSAPDIGKPAEPLLSRRRILIGIPIALVVGVRFFWLYRKKQLEAAYFQNQLKKVGLPPELYAHQSHLETLAIDQSRLTDVDWLDSSELKNLTLASPNLISLDGLVHATNLQFLDIDLNEVPVRSLHALKSAGGLRTLILRNIGTAKKLLIPEVDASFPELATVELDFRHSQISAVPPLKTCPQMKNITLDLRSTTKISEPPDLSGLTNLQTASLWLDTSRVATIKPVLTNIAALQTLKMSLDGTQLHLLSELSGTSGPEILDVSLTSPPNSPFPDLGGMTRLNHLTIHMPGQRGGNLSDHTPVPDITHLEQLESLSIFLNASDVSKLPPIGNLTGLLKLSLNLQSTKIEKLPDLSNLSALRQLTLNISNSRITELPRLTPLSNLVEMHLLLENLQETRPYSLRDIESLSRLETLEVDISGSTIRDLASIAKVQKLKTLILRLKWEQVHDLPALGHLENLCTLELRLRGSWTPPELPTLGGMQKLQKLILDIRDSHVTRLPDLSLPPNLAHLTLHLDNSDIDDLSALENVKTLKELVLNAPGTHIQTLPNLIPLQHLQKVRANIKHSQIALRELKSLAKVQELTISGNLQSLQELPVTVKQLVFDAGTGRIHVKPTEDIVNC